VNSEAHLPEIWGDSEEDLHQPYSLTVNILRESIFTRTAYESYVKLLTIYNEVEIYSLEETVVHLAKIT
jgi:hypothetical protein